VMGFDDIYAAAFHNPALTTIRQPLFEMGQLAARTLLDRLSAKGKPDIPRMLNVEPELVVRRSTARVQEPD
jgi:DNA-binding LacI/PurR family transcriptional regulator